MGKFDWNSVYSSWKLDVLVQTDSCTSSGSTSSNQHVPQDITTPTTYYDGWIRSECRLLWCNGSLVKYCKVAKVAPEPDATAPEVDHNPLRDSPQRPNIHIRNQGWWRASTGINTTKTVGVGPTFWRVTDANGTVGSWATSC